MNLCTTLQQRWETCRMPVEHHPRPARIGVRCVTPHVVQLTREHVGHFLRDIAAPVSDAEKLPRLLPNGACFGCMTWPCIGERCPEARRRAR